MGLFELFASYGMLGLFLTGLISSIIPIPTEPVVFALLDIGKNPEIILITLVTGSIFGAFLGYLVGIYGLRKIVLFHNMQKERQVQLHWSSVKENNWLNAHDFEQIQSNGEMYQILKYASVAAVYLL